MSDFLRTHRRWVLIGAAIAVAGAAFVIVWFEPHKLFIEETVNEPAPRAEPADPTPGSDTDAKESTQPRTILRGAFASLEHTTSGRALVVELADGSRVLRLEDLETSNGPDLRVYLSEIPASDDWYAYGERFVDLGALKGNLGDQNYAIPEGVDIDEYASAVIWCRRFTVGFGVAGLEEA